MSFRTRTRINVWIQEFAAWAQITWKEHEEDSDHSGYYIGVILGITDSRANNQVVVENLEVETRQGYVDARLLINKVLELGDAPEGDFYELLADPESITLRRRS